MYAARMGGELAGFERARYAAAMRLAEVVAEAQSEQRDALRDRSAG